MISTVALIVGIAGATVLGVNLVISVLRHYEHHEHCTDPIDAVIRDATDTSLRVREFTRQLGGHA